jgi:hypothetical protein
MRRQSPYHRLEAKLVNKFTLSPKAMGVYMKISAIILSFLLFSTFASSQSWAQGSIEKEFSNRIERDYLAWLRQKAKEYKAMVIQFAEETSGAKVIKMEFSERAHWLKMSNGQICVVYIYNQQVYRDGSYCQ